MSEPALKISCLRCNAEQSDEVLKGAQPCPGCGRVVQMITVDRTLRSLQPVLESTGGTITLFIREGKLWMCTHDPKRPGVHVQSPLEEG